MRFPGAMFENGFGAPSDYIGMEVDVQVHKRS